MAHIGVGARLRLIGVAIVAIVISGCVDTQSTTSAAGGLSEQLQTFAADTLRHIFAAWLL